MKKLFAGLLTLAMLIGCVCLCPIAAEETDPASYRVSFSPLPVVAVYNATPVSTEVGTKVYIDYTVNSSTIPAYCCYASVPNAYGIWPFNVAQGAGTVYYSSANQALICQPGCTYHMVYEVIEGGFVVTGTYTDAKGNIHEWQGDTYLSEPMPGAGGSFPYGGYVGITAFNGDSSMDLNIKFTDEAGNDLGVMSNRAEVSISKSDVVIPAMPRHVTYMVGEQDVTSLLDASATSFDPAVGLPAESLPTYTDAANDIRVTEWYYDAALTELCNGIAAGTTADVTLYGKTGPLVVVSMPEEDVLSFAYKIEFSALPVAAVYNSTAISTEVGTKVYIDYHVNSSDIPAWCAFASVPNPNGIWPFNYAQGAGSIQYSSSNMAIICLPGYTYHIVYEVIEGGFTFYGAYTDTEGVTHQWRGDTYLSETTPGASEPYPFGGYVGITAFNGNSSMNLNIKFTDEEGNDLGVRANMSEVLISAPVYHVTYMIGDKNVTDNFESSNYTYDSLVGLPAASLPEYTDNTSGIRVTEWYYDAGLTQLCTGIEAGTKENITLYGKTEACTYTVIYMANGGEGTMDEQTADVGSSFTLTPNAYTMEGRTFLGWSLFSNDTEPTYTDGQEVTNLAKKHGAKVYLYAIWSEPPVETEPDTTASAETSEVTEPIDTLPETTPDTIPPVTEEVTDAATDAATDVATEAVTEAPAGGCSSVLGASASALLVALAAAVVLRKKD